MAGLLVLGYFLGYFMLKLATGVLALAGAFILFIVQALFEGLVSTIFPIQKEGDANLTADSSDRKRSRKTSKKSDGDDPQSYGATYLN